MDQKGLSTEEANALQARYGKNELTTEKKESFLRKILHIISEPMFVLLLIAATIYFLLGEQQDGIIMLVFVVGIITIDVVQEWKTDKTLNALKSLSEPKIEVLRDNVRQSINSSDLVPGDIIFVHEGVKIPADGFVIKCSGLKVDESSLTGESVGVFKTTERSNDKDYWRDDYCYQGTLVIQGTGAIKVDKIGNHTEYGKIGLSVSKKTNDKTPLQKQIDKLVFYCAILALILFITVSLLTFINLSGASFKDRLIDSILSGVTLAMAMIPEEFPVVLTVFLSMGAWRLAKKHSLVKKLPSVETLGAVSVLCVDKTGTITQNRMEVAETFVNTGNEQNLAYNMCLSCEEDTYDPMETAMFKYAEQFDISKRELFKHKKLKQFPFSNENKIVGVAYEINQDILVAAKGSPESILKLCNINPAVKKEVEAKIQQLQEKGLRVIAVASRRFAEPYEIPDELTSIQLEFDGLVSLIDPPRKNVNEDIKSCYKAGVKVVMITGDNGITASAIAKSVGIQNSQNVITGEMLDRMTAAEPKEAVKDVAIFSRVVPEHKMRIVEAFQANGEIVAMTGDGVNDAPALKQANIGIAMGKNGSEVSREAADLVLLDDNFHTIVETIQDGRRIYDNIKKAIGYILIIHIPIALSSLFGPLLKIAPSDLMLLPLHVVLLELLIDPTCSIIFERQPAESNIMNRPPRSIKEGIVNKNIIIKSLLQGLIVFIGSFGLYYYGLKVLGAPELARTMALLALVFSNIFIVQVNSSDSDLVYQTLPKLIKDKVMLIINLVVIVTGFLLVYSPLNSLFGFQPLTAIELVIVFAVAFASVFWYELVKLAKRKRP